MMFITLTLHRNKMIDNEWMFWIVMMQGTLKLTEG